MTVHFQSEALAEYQEAARYAEEQFGLGEAFVQAVEAALERILRAPLSYQAVGDGVRIFRMRRFPYSIFYLHSPETENFIIYALAHDKRRSGYWRSRL
jgi:plasmid stabilization system protein ParE